MANYEVNQKLQNRKNHNNHATVARVDAVAKTAILLYEDGTHHGPFTFSSVGKSWQVIAEEVVADDVVLQSTIEETPEEKVSEEVPAEIAEAVKKSEKKKPTTKKAKSEKVKTEKPKKEKKQRAEKPKKEKKAVVVYDEKILDDILDIIDFTPYRIEVRAVPIGKQNNLPTSLILLDDDGCRRYALYLNSKSMCICMPKSKVPEGATPTKYRTCPVCAEAPTFEIGYDDIDTIKTLIN